jgi:hypothetical protein
VWCAFILGAAGLVIGLELVAPCPRGGPLAFGDCSEVRPFVVAMTAVAALLYVGGLTAVRWWTRSLVRRGVADATAARDWYLLAGGVGLLVAPLLSFTTVSGLR